MYRTASREAKSIQLKLQEAIVNAEDATAVLDIVGESAEHFSPINSVTAVYRIARTLTSRAGGVGTKMAAVMEKNISNIYPGIPRFYFSLSSPSFSVAQFRDTISIDDGWPV